MGNAVEDKSWRGAFIGDVLIRDVDAELGRSSKLVELVMKVPYNEDPQPQPGLEGITRISDIRIENVRVSGGVVGTVEGDARKPVAGLVMRSLSGRADRGQTIFNAPATQLEELTFEVKQGDWVRTGKPKKVKQR